MSEMQRAGRVILRDAEANFKGQEDYYSVYANGGVKG